MFIKGAGIKLVSPKKFQIEYVKKTHLNHWISSIVGCFVAFWACCTSLSQSMVNRKREI